MKNELLATGKVEALCINGSAIDAIEFGFEGPVGDIHSGFTRKLSGHDGGYFRTSALAKGDIAFNWRSWTGLSQEELMEVEQALGCSIPQGCLLENIVVSGIPNFSKLPPTSRLVFPKRGTQAVLAVWEENGPCHVVGKRLADHYGEPELQKRLIAGAQNRRGVMGLVLTVGRVEVGDTILVYPPMQ